ncbi:MAG: hypothetical protein QXT31_08300 [Candidatus Bathyarchaeia archaeon]
MPYEEAVLYIKRQRIKLGKPSIGTNEKFERFVKKVIIRDYYKKHPDLVKRLTPEQIKELIIQRNKGMLRLLDEGILAEGMAEEIAESRRFEWQQKVSSWRIALANVKTSKDIKALLLDMHKTEPPEEFKGEFNALLRFIILSYYGLPDTPELIIKPSKWRGKPAYRLYKNKKLIHWILLS